MRIIARLNVGGPAIHTILLTKELQDDGFRSELVCGYVSQYEGNMGYLADEYSVRPVYIGALKREIDPISDIRALFSIVREIRRFKPHIVHTHTAKAGGLGRIAALLTGVPIKVHTFHGHIFKGYFSGFKTGVFISVERLLAKFTDRIIAISQTQKDEIVNTYRITDERKCGVVKLGFDLERLHKIDSDGTLSRKVYGMRDDDIIVGIIGRLVPVKNHRMVIECAAYLKKLDDKIAGRIRFLVVGDGQLRNNIEAYSQEKDVREKIIFTGWVKNTSIVYPMLDIVILTSVNEGTPVSLIEAMAYGRPVISTDVGGVRDAIGGIGILVRSGDYKALAGEILKLAGSVNAMRRLGEDGRRYVARHYSKNRLVNELRDQYKVLLREKQSK